MRAATLAIVSLMLCLCFIGCGHRPDADLGHMHALWRQGEHQAALTEARAVIRRAAHANGVDPEDLKRRASTIRDRLSTEPVPPADAAGVQDDPRFTLGAGHLDGELQAALAHPEAIVMIRSAIAVGELKLKRHGLGLLAVIAHPGPVKLERTDPNLESPMIAWLTSKQVALDSLVQLATP